MSVASEHADHTTKVVSDGAFFGQASTVLPRLSNASSPAQEGVPNGQPALVSQTALPEGEPHLFHDTFMSPEDAPADVAVVSPAAPVDKSHSSMDVSSREISSLTASDGLVCLGNEDSKCDERVAEGIRLCCARQHYAAEVAR